MILSSEAVRLIRAVYAKYPELATSNNDDDRRTIVKRAAQQLVYSLKDNHWGNKSRSSTAPQGKDSIAYLVSSDGAMDIWDIQNGATGQLQINDNQPPSFSNVTDQLFLPVTGTNWLDNIIIPVPDNPPSDIPSDNSSAVDLSEVVNLLKYIQDKIDTLGQSNLLLHTQLVELQNKMDKIIDLAMKHPSYTGSIFGIKIVLRPE